MQMAHRGVLHICQYHALRSVFRIAGLDVQLQSRAQINCISACCRFSSSTARAKSNAKPDLQALSKRELRRLEKFQARVRKLEDWHAAEWKIVIVGRPNVGKSTLFNRLAGKKLALVDATPGVTRDRQEAIGALGDLRFTVIDTAGLEDASTKTLSTKAQEENSESDEESKWTSSTYDGRPLDKELRKNILAQTEQALQQAHIALFLIDARDGITPVDMYFARWLRKRKPSIPRFSSTSLSSTTPPPSPSSLTQTSPTSDNLNLNAPPRKKKGLREDFSTPVFMSGNVPVILLANKCEANSTDVAAGVLEAYSLGFGDPIPVSAEHGDGLADVYLALSQMMKQLQSVGQGPKPSTEDPLNTQTLNNEQSQKSRIIENKALSKGESEITGSEDDNESLQMAIQGEEQEEEQHNEPDQKAVTADDGFLQLAIVGKPNVGKSSLVNALLGEERVVTGPQPGITRDAIPVQWEYTNSKGLRRQIQLVDTAGLKGTTSLSLKKYARVDAAAMEDSLRSVDFANVVLLVLDVTDGLKDVSFARMSVDGKNFKTEKDFLEKLAVHVRGVFSEEVVAIARRVLAEGRALVVVGNKWDLVPMQARPVIKYGLKYILDSFVGVADIPVVPVSALYKHNLHRIVPTAVQQYDRWNARINTSKLNRWLRELTRFRPPPTHRGKSISLRFITQVGTRPPTFVLFSSRAHQVDTAYVRFLANALREEFDLQGTPIRLFVRRRDNPFTSSSK